MPKTPVNETHIKDLLKDALLELVQERKDLLYDIVAEVVEDLALAKAIQEGENTDTVPREDVFNVLDEAL